MEVNNSNVTEVAERNWEQYSIPVLSIEQYIIT